MVDAALCAVLVPHADPDLVGISRPTGQEVNQRWQSANLGSPGGLTEPRVSFAGNLTDDPELRHTESGIARAMFRVTISGRREQEPSFFPVIVWRNQVEHAAESLSKGSRVVLVGRLQQRSWTAEDGSARAVVEVMADPEGNEFCVD